jgi:hypothetical protein
MLQHLRSVQLLEELGTPEAQALLKKISQGVPSAFLTQEAAVSLLRGSGLAREKALREK